MRKRDSTTQPPDHSTISSTSFAWHGWHICLPRSWNPIKLEGDYRKGSALFADMDRPRLALRWDTPHPKGFNPETWTTRSLRDEVGSLAAEQARPSASALQRSALLYVDPDPPGRDVFVAHSSTSSRVIQLIHHTHKRTRTLEESIVPFL